MFLKDSIQKIPLFTVNKKVAGENHISSNMFSVNQLNLLAQHHKVACCTALKGNNTKLENKKQTNSFKRRQRNGNAFRSVLKINQLDKKSFENPSSENNTIRVIKRRMKSDSYQDKKERDLRQKTISKQDIEIEHKFADSLENYNIDESNYNVIIEQDHSPSKPRNAIQFDVHHISNYLNSETQEFDLLEQHQLKKIRNLPNDFLSNINGNNSEQVKQKEQKTQVPLSFIKNDVSHEMELESTNKLIEEDTPNLKYSKMNYINKTDSIIKQTKRDLDTSFKTLEPGQYRIHRNSNSNKKGNTFIMIKTKNKPSDCKVTCVDTWPSDKRLHCNFTNTVQNQSSPTTKDIIPKMNTKGVDPYLVRETIRVCRAIDDYRTVKFDPTVTQTGETKEEENTSIEEKSIKLNTISKNKSQIEYLESDIFKVEDNATISDYKIFEYFWKIHACMKSLSSDHLAEYKLHILKKIYEITS